MSDDNDHALLIRLNVDVLGDRSHVVDVIAALEQELGSSLGEFGEVDGHDIGLAVGQATQVHEATIFIYGADANVMFSAIEPILKSHVQLAGATVTLRFGPPGATERLLEVPN